MSKQRIKRVKDFENGTVTFTEVETQETLTVSVSELPEEVKTKLVLHGLNAKVGDSAAGLKEGTMEAMTKIWENLKDGIFNIKAESGGSRITVLAEALKRVTGQEMDVVFKKLEDMSDIERKELRKHTQVKACIQAIQAERATEKAKASKKEAKSSESLLEF